MEFSDLNSVDDFLRKTGAARKTTLSAVEEGLRSYIEDPSIIGVTPQLGELIADLVESFGDEVYRQVAIFCLGKWLEIHSNIATAHWENSSVPELIVVTADSTRLSTAMQAVEGIASFSGDKEWREMLCKNVASSVLSDFEENGLDPLAIFNRKPSKKD